MTFLKHFINELTIYANELWAAVLIGFLISGIFNEFIPTDIVKNFLGKKGVRPVLLSSFVGVLLPVCCFGSLPIAVTMRNKGARMGPTLAFLVATPATSVSALVVCWKLLGSLFTIYIFFAAIIIGLITGILANHINFKIEEEQETASDSSCCHGHAKAHDNSHDHAHHYAHTMAREHKAKLSWRIRNIFTYAFITLPKEIGLELVLGVVLASLIVSLPPVRAFIQDYLSGMGGYVFSLIFGLVTYVCSTASVPMADALIKSGMLSGPAMVYLLVGPITSYGMILAIKKKFGVSVLTFYLVTICTASIICGVLFNYLARL